MTEPQSSKKRKKGSSRMEPLLEKLLLEALEEEDVEKSVELFLAVRLIRIVRRKSVDTFTRSS